MKVSDIVSCNNRKNLFSISSISIEENSQTATLIEVNPNNTQDHLNSDCRVVTIKELNAFYSAVEK